MTPDRSYVGGLLTHVEMGLEDQLIPLSTVLRFHRFTLKFVDNLFKLAEQY